MARRDADVGHAPLTAALACIVALHARLAQHDVARRSVGRTGLLGPAAPQRSRWQRYVDAAVHFPAHAERDAPVGARPGPRIGHARARSPRSAARWQLACEPGCEAPPGLPRAPWAATSRALWPGTSPKACCPGQRVTPPRGDDSRNGHGGRTFGWCCPPSLSGGPPLPGTGCPLRGWRVSARHWRRPPESCCSWPAAASLGRSGFGRGEGAGSERRGGREAPGMVPVPGRRPYAAFAPRWLWRCCCPSRRARTPPSRRPGGMTAPSLRPWPPARLSSRNWKLRAPRGGSGFPGPVAWRTAGQFP